MANEVYQGSYLDCINHGLYTDKELLEFMFKNHLWDTERENLSNKIPKDIEDFKVKLVELVYKSGERKAVRDLLKEAKTKLNLLINERMAYNHLGCSGTAAMAKIKYLIGVCLYRSNGQPVFTDDDFWESDDDILAAAVKHYNENHVTEEVLREIARTEPWRTTYALGLKNHRLIDVPSVDYTDEQKTLFTWSALYSNVYEHPECPEDEIINDDDSMDGWLIKQKRNSNKKHGFGIDDITDNQKIKQCGEVYVPVNSYEDAVKLEELNDGWAHMIKKQRWNKIKKEGVVNELDLPDMKQNIQMQLAQIRKG